MSGGKHSLPGNTGQVLLTRNGIQGDQKLGEGAGMGRGMQSQSEQALSFHEAHPRGGGLGAGLQYDTYEPLALVFLWAFPA